LKFHTKPTLPPPTMDVSSERTGKRWLLLFVDTDQFIQKKGEREKELHNLILSQKNKKKERKIGLLHLEKHIIIL